MPAPKRKTIPRVAPDHTTSRINRAASATGAPSFAEPVAEPVKPERDLSDPKVQFEILNPETPQFAIVIDGVESKIAVPTKFSMREIRDQRVHDDISSLNELINIELIKMVGPESFGETIAANPRYYDVVLSRGIVRSAARELIAKIAYFVEADPNGPDGRPKPKRRPSVEQIGAGMDGKIVSAIALLLIINYVREVQDQKKEPTA